MCNPFGLARLMRTVTCPRRYVDYLFFNQFTYSSSRGWSFDYFLGRSYQLFTNLSGTTLTWQGVDYMAPMYTDLPWGVGAWGAGSVRAYRMIDEADRTAFIAGCNESLNSGRYPRLKLSIYFVSHLQRYSSSLCPSHDPPQRVIAASGRTAPTTTPVRLAVSAT